MNLARTWALFVAVIVGPIACNYAPAQTTQPDSLVVHEWGVQVRTTGKLTWLTPIQAVVRPMAWGVKREPIADPSGRTANLFSPPGQLIGGLPSFVLRYDDDYVPKYKGSNEGCWNKPVLHFYGPEQPEVAITVGTPLGGPLAYWPKPDIQTTPRPELKQVPGGKERWDITGITGEDPVGLSWRGSLTRQAKQTPRDVKAGHWWDAVRQVPGLWLNVSGESERFLFYEATALQEPLLVGKVTADELTLENTHSAGTGTVIVIVNDGKARHFVAIPDIKSKAVAKVAKKNLLASASDAAGEKLLATCRSQWESFGLSPAEAAAIVETWRPDLLNRVGFLVAVRAPADVYERMFPLTIRPKPAQLVRVGMFFDTLPGEAARLDWLGALEPALEKLGADLGSPKYPVRVEAQQRLADLGDLVHDYLVKLKSTTPDAEVRASAEKLLDRLDKPTVIVPDVVKRGMEKK
ncbi:MAG: hypothetical protein PHU85_02250 [Phycisphaerae bacterium]|nr:hypothetical protein [Phycisphaerae bacterium]